MEDTNAFAGDFVALAVEADPDAVPNEPSFEESLAKKVLIFDSSTARYISGIECLSVVFLVCFYKSMCARLPVCCVYCFYFI